MQSSLGHQSWRPFERVRYAELNAKYDRFLTKQSLSFSVLDFDRLRIIMDGAYFLFCGAPQKRKGIDG
jgi:hypothetical protein